MLAQTNRRYPQSGTGSVPHRPNLARWSDTCRSMARISIYARVRFVSVTYESSVDRTPVAASVKISITLQTIPHHSSGVAESEAREEQHET